ncbi:VOC family protein [Clostridium sp. 19966]|uniref:VOC family protein n=1 Tax=Clostridium sp. 19966 TaxID=2768166 RepID=UPI0028DF0FB1|nr:VOC family protein [Clostridium sp. 19966]MDT8718464.1 VOC family protein [Clostridium sp. 19966]
MSDKDFSIRMLSVVIDCKNANTLADFYASLLGWQKNTDDPEWISVSKSGITPCLLFQEEVDYKPPVWPDNPNEQQKSIHLDFAVSDIKKAIQHAIDCGATAASVQFSDYWTVMIDPEGHPFCLCQR